MTAESKSAFSIQLIVAATLSFCSLGISAIGQQLPLGSRLSSISPNELSIGGVLHGYDEDTWTAEDYLTTAEREFSSITGTSYMAYGAWPTSSAKPNVAGFNRVVDWAVSRDLRVHGHVLCYPSANENLSWWMKLPNAQVEARLKTFVQALATTRRGKVWVWDVANEVMAEDGEPMDSNGLRTEYKEYKAVGPQYVEKLFQWANQADPDALLILNDYGNDHLCPKSDRMLKYAISLRNRGVPIHGIGFQMHLLDLKYEPNYESIRANFKRFADAGFKLFITEMDVAATAARLPTPLPNEAQLTRQRRIYTEIAKICFEQPACEALWLWDFADNRSWLNPSIIDTPYLRLGEFSHPTIFSGGQGEPILAKPAYYGLQWGLSGQKISDRVGGPITISNHWAASPSFLTFDPEVAMNKATVITLSPTPEQTSQSSVYWEIEWASRDFYRIKTLVDGDWCYLTRGARLRDGLVVPTDTLYLDPIRKTWNRQQWAILPTGRGGFTIQNAWEPNTGFLTRESKLELQPVPGKPPTTQLIEIPLDKVSLDTDKTSLPARLWFLD